MPYAVGAQVPLVFTVRDSTGALVDPATATISITQPDGTPAATLTLAGGTITKVSTGTFVGILVPIQAGRYVWKPTTTGPVTAGLPDVVNVISDTDAPIVSLADARSWLGMDTPDQDDKVRRALAKATEVAEWWTGLTFRRTVVTNEVHDGGRRTIKLYAAPVLSMTSVVELGTALSSTDGVDWTLDPNTGLMYRGSQYARTTWAPGIRSVVVSYVVGMTVIPDRYQGFVEELTRHFFRTVQTTDDADEAYATSAAIRQLCLTLAGPQISDL